MAKGCCYTVIYVCLLFAGPLGRAGVRPHHAQFKSKARKDSKSSAKRSAINSQKNDVEFLFLVIGFQIFNELSKPFFELIFGFYD